MIRQLMDSAITADPLYTPSNAKREVQELDTHAMYEGWQKSFRNLKRQCPNMPDAFYALQIAKMDVARGRNAQTIRKHLKK